MKINSIINRYIFLELLPPFAINLVFFTFIFLMAKILDITKLIVNYSIGIFTALKFIVYTLPYFLEYVIPMSVMMTILLTFLRFSADNEITALRASGMSIYELLPPVLVFCLLGYLFSSMISIYGMPWGKNSLKKLTYKIVLSNLDIGLKERAFNDNFNGVMIYVNKINTKTKLLTDVFIEDSRNKDFQSTIVAPTGAMFTNSEKMVSYLRLYNGTLNQVDLKDQTAQFINFKTYDILLDLKGMVTEPEGETKGRHEMTLSELYTYIKTATTKNSRYYSILIEFHKKFSLPFACFAMGILAVPLGILSGSVRKSFGLGLGLLFFILYYFLLSAGKVFGKMGVYPPAIGMWAPNIVMGSIGIYLVVSSTRNLPLINYMIQNLMNKLKKYFRK